jgi:thymidylate synthase (FAD)
MPEQVWTAFNGSRVIFDNMDNAHLDHYQVYRFPGDPIFPVEGKPGIWNGDRLILKAARVSTRASNNGMTNFDRDKKLVRYLYEKKHTSVFEQVTYQFTVVMPLYIAEQWKRHRTWHMNQESLRYREQEEETIEFEIPEWHYQNTEGNKQGGDKLIDNPELLETLTVGYEGSTHAGWLRYRAAIDLGVAKEDARRFLPVSIMTTCMFTVDLHNLIGFLFKRCAPDAQREIRVLAYILKNKLVAQYNPWVHELINEEFTKRQWPLEYA